MIFKRVISSEGELAAPSGTRLMNINWWQRRQRRARQACQVWRQLPSLRAESVASPPLRLSQLCQRLFPRRYTAALSPTRRCSALIPFPTPAFGVCFTGTVAALINALTTPLLFHATPSSPTNLPTHPPTNLSAYQPHLLVPRETR